MDVGVYFINAEGLSRHGGGGCLLVSCVSMMTPSWLLTGPEEPFPPSPPSPLPYPQALGYGGSSSAALFYPLKSVIASTSALGWCPFDNLERRLREHEAGRGPQSAFSSITHRTEAQGGQGADQGHTARQWQMGAKPVTWGSLQSWLLSDAAKASVKPSVT